MITVIINSRHISLSPPAGQRLPDIAIAQSLDWQEFIMIGRYWDVDISITKAGRATVSEQPAASIVFS